MASYQYNNTTHNRQGNMFALEFSYPTTSDLECSNIAEVQEKHLKTICMKLIEVFKKKINKFPIEIEENTK